jgi:hypothetical protein
MGDRDEKGHFLPRPDSLGKTYGLRVRKDLDAVLAELAKQAGITPTAWCRKAVEDAIAAATNPKWTVKKSEKP